VRMLLTMFLPDGTMVTRQVALWDMGGTCLWRWGSGGSFWVKGWGGGGDNRL